MQLDKNNFEEVSHKNVDFLNQCEHAPAIRYPITDSSDQRTHLALSHLRAKAYGAASEKYGNSLGEVVQQQIIMTCRYNRPDGKTGLVDIIADVECQNLSFKPDYDIISLRMETVKEQTHQLWELNDQIADLIDYTNRPFWKKLLGIK